ncbi:glycosyl hydrolase family 61-domain-containing protein [Paraphysoderma sedebokerense]|nr:glycosyl hydrolase family 61-domain-containing protein [Paraphysoderma sedebokerense]
MIQKCSSLLTALSLVLFLSSVQGHIYLHSFVSNGQESGTCVRQLPPDSVKNAPIKNVEGQEMMCNVGRTGDTVTFQFYHNGPSASDDIIDKSHLAPCSVYLSNADASGNPTGWFKIFQKGYNSGSKQWCSDELIAARGKLPVQIPAGLEDGRYVFRTEIIALHEADKTIKEDPNRGAQLYVNCGDINIKGGSGSLRPATVQIPSAQWATFNSPGIKFNIWNRENPNYGSYVVPGPPVLAASTNEPGNSRGSPNSGSGDGAQTGGNPGSGNGGQSGGNPGNSGSGSGNQGGQFPTCKGNQVTETGQDGRKWGYENGQSCLISGSTGGQGQVKVKVKVKAKAKAKVKAKVKVKGKALDLVTLPKRLPGLVPLGPPPPNLVVHPVELLPVAVSPVETPNQAVVMVDKPQLARTEK